MNHKIHSFLLQGLNIHKRIIIENFNYRHDINQTVVTVL